MKKAVILFTKAPLPGHSKTRLMPYWKAEQAAALQLALLKDEAGELGKLKKNTDVFIYYALQEAVPEKTQKRLLTRIFGENAFYRPQEGKGLGERMHLAIDAVLDAGYGACVLCGSDIPQLCVADMTEAFVKLKTADVIFGPTVDGGYYLVGMRKKQKDILKIRQYSTPSVLAQTLKKAEKRKLRTDFVTTRRDLDTKEDIQAYRQYLRRNKCFMDSYTGRFLLRSLSIAVIIPTYNEEKTVLALQKQLRPLLGKCEIIFVDGGSTDATASYIHKDFTLLHAPKGRNHQMNTGALHTEADVLFFLHCDSSLPPKPLEQIRMLMATHRAACFGIAFKSLDPLMFICRYISNHRVFDRRVMFGDQGIFVERELFFAVGMFPDLPIMEDYQFSLSLKARGERFGMTPYRICTSARRFQGGYYRKLKLMWKMNRLRKMYRDGVAIEKIARLYKDIR